MKTFVRCLFAICGLLGLSNIALAQAPTISYPSPTYVLPLNVAVSPAITPTSTGVTGAFNNTTTTFYNAANGTTFGVITYDTFSGNFYAVANGNLYKITTAGAATTINTTTLSNATSGTGIITDGLGNIYVSDSNNNNLYEFSSAGALIRTIGGLNGANGVAVDASNNVYVVDANTNSVYKIAAGLSTTKTAILTGFTAPYGIAINTATGDMYVTQNGGTNATRNIIKIANAVGGSTTKTTFVPGGSGLTGPRDLTFDVFGDLFLGDGTTIKMISPAGVVTTALTLTGATAPGQVDFDLAGNMYIADGGRTIKESAVSYYTISAALPTGLTFNTTTGVISGTPTVAAGPTVYTVTAHNTTSNVTTTITITCKVAAPVITYTTPDTYIVGSTVSLTPTNSGSPITSASTLPTLPAGLTISNAGVISGTPTTVTAAANYVVTATNAGGSGTFTVNITINPKAPVITYNTPNVYTTGVPITLLSPNTSGGGAVASYAISPALPAGLSIDPVTGIISGTPTGTATIATYTVTATNVTGSGTFGISITVNPPKPVITYSTPQTYVVGTPITTLSVANSGGPITSFSVLPALPAGLSLNTSTGDITGTPTAQSTATNYVVTATNAGGNGTFTISITVNPIPPLITYTNNDVYVVGTAITPNLTPNASGGGPVASYSAPTLPAGLSINASTGVISGTPTAVSPPTGYTVTATNQGGTGTFTITITVNNPPVPNFTYTNPAAITYGGSVSVTPANSGGIPTSCTISPTGTGVVVSATGVVSGTPNAAGTTVYTITPSNAGGAGPGATVTITVNQKALTVTANTQTKVYGAALPTLTFTYSGFIAGESAANLTTPASASTTATASSAVGAYPITVGGAVDPNYTYTYVASTLTITKAALTVKANAQTKSYGTAFAFAGTEFTTTGLQAGDAVTSATLTSPGAAAIATVAGSPYTISISGAVGTGLSNYTITYTTNTFTVNKIPLIITANNQTKVYGNTFTFTGNEFTVGDGQLANSDNVTGATITSTGSAATATVPGSPYPIVISNATGTGLANYTISYINGSMTVTPAPLTVTANSQTRDVGVTTALTVTYTGFKNGETSAALTTQPTVSTTATTASPVGTYPITATGAVDPNYAFTYVPGILTITAAGTHAYVYDWTGTANTTWENPLNWSIGGVQQTVAYPGYSSTTNATADIGVNILYNAAKSPVISSTINVSLITFGSDNATQIGLTVNGTLTTTSSITLQADNNIFGNSLTTNLSGTGTINVPNLNVINNQTALTFETTSINSSVANLNVAGNISLTTTVGFLATINSAFILSGGTTTVGGTLTTSNNPGFFATTTSTFSIIPTTTATLNLTNANAINLDNNTSVIDFDHTGSIVNYTGSASPQTVYTSSTPNANTGVKYQNLTISTTGSGVPASGTLTVDKNLVTSGPTNFGTNAPTVNVAGTWTNTANVTQGAATITVNTQLINTANTITGGAGALTAASKEFNGGNLIAGAGTVTSTGTYQNDGGTFNCGTAANANVNFNGTYTNNSGIFIANPTSTSKVSFTGTNQTLVDKTTAGTTFNNVTFSGNNTAITGSTGNFAVAATGTLTMSVASKLTAGSGTVGGAGYLTLMSNATSTATIAAMPANSSIQGNVNVQRFITGGAGTRGYRLLTSPVNVSNNASGGGNLSLTYLNANGSFGGITYAGAFTEGPGSGFTYNGSFNPIIYLYDESRPSTNQGFTAGKNVGIYSITGNTVTTLAGSTQTVGVGIPVGNSYLLYYVGDNHLTDQSAVLAARVPESIDITATGYINQGSVPVKFWNTNSTNIPYDVTTGTSYPGLNQVGNPYPSTITLDQVAADNAAINKVFWELVPGGSYVSYNAANHAVSDVRASKYILSSQGFLVEAQATGETLTFKEDQKIAYPSGLASPFNTATGTALLMDIPSKPGVNNNSDVAASTDNRTFQALLPPTSALTGLHLQLTKDSINFVQTGLYFGTGNNDKYTQNEDAISVSGSGAKVFLSSYSSDNVNVGINQLGDYSATGKRIKLYAGVTATGSYTISLADLANIDTINYNVFLIDKKLNDSLDMVRYKSYSFNINNSDTSTYGANRFVLAIEHAAVPQYLLTSFRAFKVQAGVQLLWTTMNAGNYTGYILQKRDNKGNFNPLYSTQSVNGTSSYSYVDLNPVIGNNTYRLLQNDVNGKITYSDTVTIKYTRVSRDFAGLTLYPNPSNSIINVIYTNATSDKSSPNYSVDIFNSIGTFIKHESINSNSWTEDISAYKIGVYVLQVKDSSGNLVGQTKFIRKL